MALSLYRKYRPEIFADVVGQEHVEKTLINAISEGTVAHAYLFCGPRGTGKTTTARLLAKALLCESGPSAQPDGTCPQCQEISQGVHPDVFELDAASRTGVEDVREEIIGRVHFAPTRGRSKIYIIDEVHMLSTSAFNALLKTLEEPPEHVVFVLCTTDPHKVPETIQSRCQRFDFRRFSVEEIMGYLERICKSEGFDYESEALEFIAAKSAGGMRDATTSLEQVGVYTEGKITLDEATRMFGQIDTSALFEIAEHIARHDTAACFLWVYDLVGKGVDLAQFARDLASHFRDLYVTSITGGENGIVSCTAAQLSQYQQQAQAFGGPDRLSRALDVCSSLVAELRNSPDARMSVEIALTRLTRPESQLTLEALAERIESLESGIPSTIGTVPAVDSTIGTVPVVDNPSSSIAEAVPVSESAAYVSEFVESKPAATVDAGFAADSVEAAAEKATPETEPQPVVSSANMTPERLRLAVLSIINRNDPSVSALLNGTTLVQENDQYHIQFPSGSEFQMRLVDSTAVHELIAGAFEEVLGSRITFSCRIGSFDASPADLKPASEPSRSVDFDDGSSFDDGYYDALAASENAAFSSMNSDDTSGIADMLSAFGQGVKIQEINDEQ